MSLDFGEFCKSWFRFGGFCTDDLGFENFVSGLGFSDRAKL